MLGQCALLAGVAMALPWLYKWSLVPVATVAFKLSLTWQKGRVGLRQLINSLTASEGLHGRHVMCNIDPFARRDSAQMLPPIMELIHTDNESTLSLITPSRLSLTAKMGECLDLLSSGYD